MFSKIRKGLKKFMNEKIEACKEIISNDQNRLILGLVILGTGIGLGSALIISAYIHVQV